MNILVFPPVNFGYRSAIRVFVSVIFQCRRAHSLCGRKAHNARQSAAFRFACQKRARCCCDVTHTSLCLFSGCDPHSLCGDSNTCWSFNGRRQFVTWRLYNAITKTNTLTHKGHTRPWVSFHSSELNKLQVGRKSSQHSISKKIINKWNILKVSIKRQEFLELGHPMVKATWSCDYYFLSKYRRDYTVLYWSYSTTVLNIQYYNWH